MKHLFIVLLFLSSCASVQRLDGGEIDKTPPKVVSTSPDSAQLFVTSPTIVVEFDEYVKTNNTSELLIISPSQKTAPSIRVKGRKVFIELNDSLQKNTTYSINFNGSIVDFNEGNPMESFNYVFSTGNYIDSFSYQGSVLDVLTNTSVTKCNVHLYKSSSDSIILRSKPDYVVQSTDNGTFVFNNLPLDSFLVYALVDDNKNLILNNEERVSLSKHIFTQSNSSDTLVVFPYHKPMENKPALSKRHIPGILTLVFKKPVKSDSVVIRARGKQIPYTFNQTKDTIASLYFPDQDTTIIEVLLDTNTYKLNYILGNKQYHIPLNTTQVDGKINIYTSYTIDSVHPQKIRIIQDSIPVKNNITQIDIQNISISGSLDLSKRITVLIDSGFVTDKNKRSNISDSITLLPQLIEKPSLSLKVQLKDSSHYILQLLSNTKVIKQFYLDGSTQLTIPRLNPGEYDVLLIEDSNNNKLWDTGNPFTKKQPEKRILSERFEMRLNWDKELIISDL